MKTCIVLDSNIWISNLLLRTPISSALLYGIVQSKSKIGIPDVVFREVFINTEKRGLKILDEARKNIRLLSYFDNGSKSAKDDLPDKEKISKAFIIRLAELKKIIFRHEHTLSEMQQALEMVLRTLPPNSEKNQQYKDSLLWQAILSLADKYMVYFVSTDRGFFKNREYAQGPADNIIKDIKSKNNNIKIYHEVESCTTILQTPEKPIDEQAVIKNIFIAEKDSLNKKLKKEGLIIKDLEDGKLKSFITSDPAKIAVKFEIKCELSIGDFKHEFTRPGDELIYLLKAYTFDEAENRKHFVEFNGSCLVSTENNEPSSTEIKWISWTGRDYWGHSEGRLGIPRWPKNGPQILGEIDWD